jgi:Zn-finger nucleic acid-binding protein
MFCPRDGTTLISPEDIDKSVFSRNGIFHCPTCSGLALNSGAASSEICSEKLKSMHDGFKDEGTTTEICCPFCQSSMKVRDFAFRKMDGTLTELIEIDGCPKCSSFWFDSGELQRLSPPIKERPDSPKSEAKALAVVLDLLFHLPYVLL